MVVLRSEWAVSGSYIILWLPGRALGVVIVSVGVYNMTFIRLVRALSTLTVDGGLSTSPE